MKNKKSDVNWVIVSMLIALIVLGVAIFLINKFVVSPSNSIQTCSGGLGECSTTETCENGGTAVKNPMGGDKCEYCCIKTSG